MMDSLRTGPLAACLALLCFVASPTVYAQEAAPGLVVTYVEAPASKATALAADVQAYAAQIRAGAEKPQVTVLTEVGRPSRMVILEHWPDVSSPAEAQAGSTLAAKIQPDTLAPIDRRLNHPLTPSIPQEPSSAFHVLMHVDVGPGTEVEALLKAQRDAVLAAPGALGYEVAVQDKRTNHFAVHQVWTSRKAYEAYAATAPAEDLRRRLAPLLGSPFDERFYTAAPQ